MSSAEELLLALEKEKSRNAALIEEVRRLKSEQIQQVNHSLSIPNIHHNLRQHIESEQEEEFITNRLLKTLRNLEQEKYKILVDIDREQEYLTNTLHRKMSKVLKEKELLESQLKIEQDYLNDTLQKQWDNARSQRM